MTAAWRLLHVFFPPSQPYPLPFINFWTCVCKRHCSCYLQEPAWVGGEHSTDSAWTQNWLVWAPFCGLRHSLRRQCVVDWNASWDEVGGGNEWMPLSTDLEEAFVTEGCSMCMNAGASLPRYCASTPCHGTRRLHKTSSYLLLVLCCQLHSGKALCTFQVADVLR
jgi:hypothetical protein